MAVTLLDQACELALLGLHVFACLPRSKEPATTHGQDDATLDLAQLDKWFARRGDLNLAVACGPSQIVVLDADTPRAKNDNTDGRARLRELEAEYGALPRTPTQDTGGGGEQYFFRAPAGVEFVGKVGRAIDIKRNGYVVVPPSVHPDTGRTYQWRAGLAPDDIEIAELPAQWIEFLRRPEHVERTATATNATGESIFDALASLDQRYVLECLSGSSIVAGERFQFRRTARGKWNLYVDRGDGWEGTSNFVDAGGKIGAHSSGGKEDGGPLASTWLRWYGHDDRAIRKALVEGVPELGRWERERKERDYNPDAWVREAVDRAHVKSNGEPLERPEITISSDQAGTVDAAERALARMGGIYVRARSLVQVVRDVSESHGLSYPSGAPVIVRLQRERLRELCGQAARWLSSRKSKKTGTVEIVETQCPAWVPATLEQRQQWKLPYLERVADTPVLRADGTIHDCNGYDPATRAIYDPGSIVYPAIPKSPTQADAQRAYRELLEVVCDVPFVADCDRAAWLSLALTTIARSAIDGPTPLHLVRASIRGAGKGLATDVGAVIATGRAAPKRPPVVAEDELRKAMLAYAIESPAIVVFDNIEGALGSPTLAAILTADSISDRLLGVSENRTAKIRFVLAATGNNIQLRGDLGRRVLPIDLDPRMEHPEDRAGFRYPDLLEHVMRERPRLVVAALTILRGYFVAGRPAHGAPTLGSYEAWDHVVRGSIVWASGVDPVAGQQRIRDEGDEDAERLAALLVAWRDTFGSNHTSVAEAIRKATDYEAVTKQLANPDLHDALAAYCRDGKIVGRRIGDVLKQYQRRICGGLEIVRHPGRAGVAHWAVEPVEGGR